MKPPRIKTSHVYNIIKRLQLYIIVFTFLKKTFFSEKLTAILYQTVALSINTYLELVYLEYNIHVHKPIQKS